MSLSLSLDLSQPSPPDPIPSVEWEAWGEEATIDLCEVQLGFDGTSISTVASLLEMTIVLTHIISGISTIPLPPLYHSSGLQLSQLSFVCGPPPYPNPAKSPTSMKIVKTTNRTSETQVEDQGQIYLVASFIDFGNCESSSS
jgi:hypothetical protein